jgi:hypothetical protein
MDRHWDRHIETDACKPCLTLLIRAYCSSREDHPLALATYASAVESSHPFLCTHLPANCSSDELTAVILQLCRRSSHHCINSKASSQHNSRDLHQTSCHFCKQAVQMPWSVCRNCVIYLYACHVPNPSEPSAAQQIRQGTPCQS